VYGQHACSTAAGIMVTQEVIRVFAPEFPCRPLLFCSSCTLPLLFPCLLPRPLFVPLFSFHPFSSSFLPISSPEGVYVVSMERYQFCSTDRRCISCIAGCRILLCKWIFRAAGRTVYNWSPISGRNCNSNGKAIICLYNGKLGEKLDLLRYSLQVLLGESGQ